MKKESKKYKKAVALHYDPDQTPAPKVVARGAGQIAEKIKKIADENNIPIIEDDLMLNLLFPLQLGEMIPESLYQPVAKLLAYLALYRQKLMQEKSEGKQ